MMRRNPATGISKTETGKMRIAIPLAIVDQGLNPRLCITKKARIAKRYPTVLRTNAATILLLISPLDLESIGVGAFSLDVSRSSIQVI